MILIKRSTTTKNSLILLILVACLMVDTTSAAKLRRTKATTAAPPDIQTNVDVTNAGKSTNSSSMHATAAETEEVAILNEKQQTVAAAAAATTTSASTATAVAPSADDAISSLSVWSIVRSVWNWIREDLGESLLGTDDDDTESAVGGVSTSSSTASGTTAANAAVEGRTFGKIRRLQMALIPIIFKFGVLTAMVAFLVMLGLKTLFLVKVLVLMNAAAILGKFLTLKTNIGHYEHPPAPVSWGYSNWNPHAPSHGWSESAPAPVVSHQAPSKEIHLHIHGAQTQPQVSSYSSYGAPSSQNSNGGWERRNDPYNAYDAMPINAMSEIDIDNELNNQGPISALPTKYPANHRY